MPGNDRLTGYRVGDITIDLDHRTLRRGSETLSCGKLTYELFVLLAEQSPSVVSREVIAERLWRGRFVTPATIKRRIALLRRTLGDSAAAPRYVRVHRGQGYSLIGTVGHMAVGQQNETARRGIFEKARVGLAVGVFFATFVGGAEIGYQDGLTPRVRELQKTQSIYVTAAPWDLGDTDHAFVIGAAERFLSVVNRSSGSEGLAWESMSTGASRKRLTVLAKAATDDVESLYLTLALLQDARPSFLTTRNDELQYWSRMLQDAHVERAGPNGGIEILDQGSRSGFGMDHYVRVFSSTDVEASRFVIVAAFRFERADIAAYPQALQNDAARYVAMAINASVAQHDAL